jgi:hypothetical protein
VYVVYGPVTADASLGTARGIIEGASGQAMGAAVAGSGDADGAGYDDVLVGLPDASSVGAAWLFDAPIVGTRSATDATWIMSGGATGAGVGSSVSRAGDANGDGIADVLVGSDRAASSTASGHAFLFLGPLYGTETTSSADVAFDGGALYDAVVAAGDGDMNGDGLVDVVVGSKGDGTTGTNAGAAYLFQAPLGNPLAFSEADAAWTGESTYDRAGTAVTLVGDSDGDGYDDAAIGADGDDSGGTDAGAVYLVLGGTASSFQLSSSTAGAKLVGPSPCGSCSGYTGAGEAVSSAGDPDGDGLGDVLVGGSGAGIAATGDGAAWLVYGPVTGLRTLDTFSDAVLSGATSYEHFGVSVAGAGDLDGDGASDVLVGASWDATAGSYAGAAYLFQGGGY